MSSVQSAHPYGNAPETLSFWLLDRCYTSFVRSLIVEHVICHGTLAGLVEIELLAPEDYAFAEEVFVAALPSVPQTDRQWCDPMEWTLPDLELEAIFAEEFSTECDRRDAVDPPPIRGGAPTVEDALDTLRRWYRERESFGQWLEREGGIAWEEGREDQAEA